jgi:hypothetical protein
MILTLGEFIGYKRRQRYKHALNSITVTALMGFYSRNYEHRGKSFPGRILWYLSPQLPGFSWLYALGC